MLSFYIVSSNFLFLKMFLLHATTTNWFSDICLMMWQTQVPKANFQSWTLRQIKYISYLELLELCHRVHTFPWDTKMHLNNLFHPMLWAKEVRYRSVCYHNIWGCDTFLQRFGNPSFEKNINHCSTLLHNLISAINWYDVSFIDIQNRNRYLN